MASISGKHLSDRSRKTRGLRTRPRVRAAVATYVDCALSPNTKRAYQADLLRFRSWGGTVPCTARCVARYLAHSASALKPSTLTRRLAAIAHAHNARGIASPTSSSLVKSTLRGIRRAHGCRQKQALPVTLQLLRRIAKTNPAFSRLRNARDRALLLVGFAGGFRRSELASLRLGDITFTRKGVIIRIRSAKTDPFARGRDVAIPYSTSGDSCPVTALKRWLQLLRPHVLAMSALRSVSEFPLFSGIDRHGHIRPGLNAASIGWLLVRRIRAAGIQPAGFSAHSLRAGLVTSAALAGVPIWSIQRQTGHRTSMTVQRYIRNVDAFACNASRGLL